MRRSSWSRRGIIVGSASLLLLAGVRASAPRRRGDRMRRREVQLVAVVRPVGYTAASR